MRQEGFSVVELLVATAILSIVASGVFALLFQGQFAFRAENDLNRTTSQARIVMDQISRYIRFAGNDPLGALSDDGIPAIEILGSQVMRINSDITGSVAAKSKDSLEAGGDPDGTLQNAMERVTVRYRADSETLWVDVGYGEELLASRVRAFRLDFFDRAGAQTTDSSSVARVRLALTMVSEATRMGSGEPSLVTLHSDVFLRQQNYEPF